MCQRAEVESGTQRLEAETKDPPATMPMETGRPTTIPPHRWWAEDEHLSPEGLSGDSNCGAEAAGMTGRRRRVCGNL